MAGPPPSPERDLRSESQPPPAMPRWVLVLGLIAVLLVLLYAGLHLSGNSPMGPGGHSAPSSVAEPRGH